MFAIFTTEQQAIAAEAFIQNFLLENRPGYWAERWAIPQKHPTEELWAFPLPPEWEQIDLGGHGAEFVAELSADWVEEEPGGSERG